MEIWLVILTVLVAVAIFMARQGSANATRIRRLEGELRVLAANLARLEQGQGGIPMVKPVDPPPVTQPIARAETPPASLPAEAPAQPVIAASAEAPPPPEPATPSAPTVTPSAPPPKPARNWEKLIGVTLPVWLGAIALSLAGFFFVRYAIESGLMTPPIRAIACVAAALVLLAGAEFVRRRDIANGGAIASALAAAGVATLYAAVYVASVAYPLLPGGAGLILMGVVTFVAIALSPIYGQLVAVIGFLGGYFAPLFYASDDPAPLPLFAYLTAILIAGFAVVRAKGWWMLSIPLLLGPVLWLWAWSGARDLAADPWIPGIFAVLVMLVVLGFAWPHWREREPAARLIAPAGKAPPQQAVVLANLAAVVGLLAVLWGSRYALPAWQIAAAFGVIVVGLGFAFGALRFLQLWAAAGTALALLLWDPQGSEALPLLIGIFAAIYGFGALDQLRRLREPALWSAILGAVLGFFYLYTLFEVSGWAAARAQPVLWAAIALALAGLFLALLAIFGPRVPEGRERDLTYAVLAGMVSAFLALAVVVALDPVYFPLAAALQVLGLAAIHRRVPVNGLLIAAAIHAVIYGLLIVGAAGGTTSTASAFTMAVLASDLRAAPWPLLVIPGLVLLLAATLIERHPPRPLGEALDIGGMVALVLGCAIVALPEARIPTETVLYADAARLLNPELAIALAALAIGARRQRPALWASGAVLAVVCAVALAAAVIAPVFGFWPHVDLGPTPIFNIALLTLGTTGLLLILAGWQVAARGGDPARYVGTALSIVGVLALFSLVLVEVRHAFHPNLLQGMTGTGEFYAYSAATLLFGIALLVAGVVLKSLPARVLSLVFVLAATVKVFLFDASELTGLWRVLSFLGMGLAFLAISWFYARFVFGLGRKSAPPPEATP